MKRREEKRKQLRRTTQCLRACVRASLFKSKVLSIRSAGGGRTIGGTSGESVYHAGGTVTAFRVFRRAGRGVIVRSRVLSPDRVCSFDRPVDAWNPGGREWNVRSEGAGAGAGSRCE